MAGSSVRLDTWLDVACLFKTRSEAQKALRTGKVQVNGQPAKTHRPVKVGDELRIERLHGRTQIVTVLDVADHHVARADARLLYEDRTPPPSPVEIEARRAERIYRAAAEAAGTPDKRQRRQLRTLKGRI